MNVVILSLLLLGCVVHHCDCLPREVDDEETKAEFSSLLHRLTKTDDDDHFLKSVDSDIQGEELTPLTSVLRSDNDTDELVPIPVDFQSDDESDDVLQDASDESDVAPVGVTQRFTGYVYSPGYSSNTYPNNYRGYWRSYTSSGYVFRVRFTVMSLEYHSTCAYDSVSLYDSYYTSSSRLIGKYCRSTTGYLTTTGRYIYLYFKTDGSVNRGRFLMYWQAVRQSPQTTCGVPRITPSISWRIVGGTEARRNSWPWQCYLWFDFRPSINARTYCGGTVISNRYILTAAHCLYYNNRRVSNSRITVRCGLHNRLRPESTTQTCTGVSRSYVHERYGRSARFDSDVAVIRLRITLRFNNYVQPVCLARSRIASGTRCVVTGWGRTQNTGSNYVLRQAVVSTLSLTSCRYRWGSSRVTSNMQCTSTSQRRGICSGDSGGPLVCKRGTTWYQYGISSWGNTRNCISSYPSVFANVASLRSWIQRKTGIRSSQGMESDDEGLEFEDDSDSEDGSDSPISPEGLENKLDGSEVPIKPYGVGEVPLDDDDPEPAAGDLYAAEKELLDELQRKLADD